ncbi:MAG: SDR family NAD(P)-dependent oxidoreductase [Parachlamydiaceae bacterium]|nr:SDR family NAD(P)-dependent oxidoreductase [Parachlamydiaceae bacterium]
MDSKDILLALRKGELSLSEAEALITKKKTPPKEPLQVAQDQNNIQKHDYSNKIAIVGIAGRYPGAENLSDFWNNLVTSKNCITEVSKERWDSSIYYDHDKNKEGKTNCKWGGFIEGAYEFDPQFFNIAPADAEGIDPQQRIFLQEAYKAFEDAGYTKKQLNNHRCGVYLGIMGSEYAKMLYKTQSEEVNITGNSLAIASARIAYHFNLKGPAISIDTACSSSLVATHLACQSLNNGEIDLALVGGVTLYLNVESYISMSKAGMLSSDGLCRAFDNQAAGFIPGEGVGAIVLKRLDDAEKAGDIIYGVIIASGINQDGKTNGITAPSANSQTTLINDVYERNCIDPKTISYVEMHGTGTKLGDPIELDALSTVYQNKGVPKHHLAIGSLKTNIGHTSAAAGVASIHKVLLCLRNKMLVPSLNFSTPNEHFDFSNSPMYVNTECKSWTNNLNSRLRAGVSSFGFSGTNAHLVIEEYIKTNMKRNTNEIDTDYIVVISAKDIKQLKEYAESLLVYLKHNKDVSLSDLAFTLQLGRDAMEKRIAFVVQNQSDLLAKITSFIETNRVNPKKEIVYEKADNDLIHKWIEARDFLKISDIWMQGTTIDWNLLYPKFKPNRVSLPTYPFKKNVYIVPELIEKKISQSVIAHELENPSSPLTLYKEIWEEKESVQFPKIASKIIYFSNDDADYISFREILEKESEKHSLILVTKGISYKKVTNSIYEIAPDILEDYLKLFEGIIYDSIPVKIVFRWGENEEVKSIESIFLLLKGIGQKFSTVNKILLISKNSNTIKDCYSESWIGFERTIALLSPNINISTLTFENTEVDLNKLWVELWQLGNIKYNYNKRYRLTFAHEELKQNISIPINKNGTYLITGGFGGLGQIFAKHLAKEYSANLILFGKRPLNNDILNFLKELNHSGTKIVEYYNVDIANRSEMQILFEAINSKYLHINGLLHCAGIDSRVGLYDKNLSAFSDHLNVKIEGTILLDEFTKDLDLDFICYFSSSAAVLGDFGACDYAVSNRFQMSYSHYRNKLVKAGKRKGKTIAINWPFWKEGGMGLDDLDRASMYLKTSGQRFLEKSEGISIFESSLSSPLDALLAIPGDPARIKEILQRKYHVEESNEKLTVKVISDLDDVKKEIRAMISSLLKIKEEYLDDDALLAEFGFDSISLTKFAKQINKHFSSELQLSDLFTHNTLQKLSNLLSKNPTPLLQTKARGEDKEFVSTSVNKKSFSEKNQEKIAVIGISGRFPGANNIEEFWDVLIKNKTKIGEIPTERKSWKNYQNQNDDSLDKECLKGAFINDIDSFDPLFFEISPRDAELMDPRQRMLLEESWKAFENAGYTGKSIAGKPFGVYVGVEDSDSGDNQETRENATSCHNAILAARISHYLDITGPNLSINTACSSSMVALHQACNALLNGECEIALAAGVSLNYSPTTYSMLNKMGFLSKDGKCQPFDPNATGLVPGEAVVAVVLKPLSEAERDGDNIYCIINGTGINYDGKTLGITAPNSEAQTELLRKIIKRNDIALEDINFILAHSVGSTLGDVSELKAYKKVFDKSGGISFGIGSIKQIVGHSFAASGIVNLIAIILMLKNQFIPATDVKDPLKEFEDADFGICNEGINWRNPEVNPRQGLIGATGMSGTNAFAFIKEYLPKPTTILKRDVNHLFLFPLSAKRLHTLKEMVKNLSAFILNNPNIELENIAYTLQIARSSMKERIIFSAKNRDELLYKISNFLKGTNPNSDYFIGSKSGQTDIDDKLIEKAKAQFLNENDIKALAELWVKHIDIDWKFLHPDIKTKISLPSYPFISSPIHELNNDIKTKKRICVIGAGPSGLVMAKSLLEEGHEPVIFERLNTIGGVWNLKKNKTAGAYKKTRFQTSKFTSTFSDFYLDDLKSIFYSVEDVNLYLNEYAKKFNLNNYLNFHSEVTKVEKSENGWEVEINREGNVKKEFFDGVAMCQGMYWHPHIPQIEGLEKFQGEIIHSGQYFDNSNFKDKNVLVIGNGVSGMDIAEEASHVAKKVLWSFRSLKLILPRMVGFIPNDCVSVANLLNPENRSNQVERLKRSMPEYYESYVQSGLLPSQKDLNDHSTILINDNIVHLVAQKKIHTVGEISRITSDGCLLNDARHEKIDLIVFCTGYKVQEDAKYLKNISLLKDFSLGIFYSKDPSLVNTASQVAIGYSGQFFYSEMVARWYARVLSGKYKLTIQELNYRISDAHQGLVGSISNIVLGLKLGLIPDPKVSFKKFWSLINLPAFPMINRLMGEHSFDKANEYLEMYRKSSYSKTEEHEPKLKQLKLRILAGLGQQSLDNLLQHNEITKDEYLGACQFFGNAIQFDWEIQYIKKNQPKERQFNMNSNNQIEASLKQRISKVLKINESDLDSCTNLSEFGFDSMTLTEFAKEITTDYPFMHLSASTFLEFSTIESLSKFLVDKYQNNFNQQPIKDAVLKEERPQKKSEDDIAIIGIGGRFPSSNNLNDFWNYLVQEKSVLKEVPESRWDWKKHFGDPKENDKTDCYHGSFLDDIYAFDALHFGITPKEAILMDPQHRILLELAWETIENGGYTKKSLFNNKIGLFVGVEKNEYLEKIINSNNELDGYVNTGNTHSMLVNRISNYFG